MDSRCIRFYSRRKSLHQERNTVDPNEKPSRCWRKDLRNNLYAARSIPRVGWLFEHGQDRQSVLQIVNGSFAVRTRSRGICWHPLFPYTAIWTSPSARTSRRFFRPSLLSPVLLDTDAKHSLILSRAPKLPLRKRTGINNLDEASGVDGTCFHDLLMAVVLAKKVVLVLSRVATVLVIVIGTSPDD